jgi:manganese efflux pump family protein
MSLLTIVGIAVGLGMDAFAVSIVAGSRLKCLKFRPVFRLSFHFGLFQFLMPILGWFAGNQVASQIKDYDHWVAFGLLLIIGGKMIYESVSDEHSDIGNTDMTRKWTMVMLSIATSIDALAVGLSLAMLNIEILFPSIIIGIVASAMTLIGMLSGKKLGDRFGNCMGVLGGVILIGIGLKILIEHFIV